MSRRIDRIIYTVLIDIETYAVELYIKRQVHDALPNKIFSAKHLKVQLESGKLTDSVTGSALLIKYRFRILFELRNFTFQLIIQHEQQQSNRSGNRSFSLLSNRAIASNTKAILNRYFIVIWFRDVQNIKLQFKSHTLFFDCQFMIFSQN